MGLWAFVVVEVEVRRCGTLERRYGGIEVGSLGFVVDEIDMQWCRALERKYARPPMRLMRLRQRCGPTVRTV